MNKKRSVANTFNGIPKDDKLKNLGVLLLSISAKNAVKMTMILTDVNPIKAIKSNPSCCSNLGQCLPKYLTLTKVNLVGIFELIFSVTP